MQAINENIFPIDRTSVLSKAKIPLLEVNEDLPFEDAQFYFESVLKYIILILNQII